MNYFVNYVNLLFTGIVVINCHGMGSKSFRDCWVINSMATYNYKIRNYPIILVISFLLYAPKIKVQNNVILNRFTLRGEKIGKVGPPDVYFPTSSVIGKIVHSKSAVPKTKPKDTGNYVHMEHGITFASSTRNSNMIAEVHKKALEYYVAWDPNYHNFENAPTELEKFEDWIYRR
jgi:hypothetical protein